MRAGFRSVYGAGRAGAGAGQLLRRGASGARGRGGGPVVGAGRAGVRANQFMCEDMQARGRISY